MRECATLGLIPFVVEILPSYTLQKLLIFNANLLL